MPSASPVPTPNPSTAAHQDTPPPLQTLQLTNAKELGADISIALWIKVEALGAK